MPATAFSQHYARELDVEQLAWLLTHIGPVVGQQSIPDLSPWADWIRNDIQCSSCGKRGAQIVRPGKARGTTTVVRQAHFRFTDQSGGDAHHPFCEFYSADDTMRQPDSLINFGAEKSVETRAVRTLICKGIEQKIFDQAAVRSMRQWFFDLKSSTRFTVTASPEIVDWAQHLQRHPSYHRWEFHPAQADMPAFDWKAAAKFQFTEENLTLIECAKRVMHDDAHWKRARDLSERHFAHEVFDTTVLQPFYDKSVALCAFVGKNSNISFSKTRPEYFRFNQAPAPLLALCALMLFVSDWDLNVAIGKFAKLLNAPEPADFSHGNVIGLNPFHDYAAWRLIILASEVAAKSSAGIDYAAQLKSIESRLQQNYAIWKSTPAAPGV